MKHKIFWFDVETTGTHPRRNGIIQLACIIEVGGKVVEEKDFRMNPANKEFSEEAEKVHGFTKEEVESFPLSINVKHEIDELMKKYVDPFDKRDKFWVGGHNVKFDVDFLKNLWQDTNDRWLFSLIRGGGYLDTGALFASCQATNILKMTPNRQLETLAHALGVDLENAHDAMSDIRATREIFYKILSVMEDLK